MGQTISHYRIVEKLGGRDSFREDKDALLHLPFRCTLPILQHDLCSRPAEVLTQPNRKCSMPTKHASRLVKSGTNATYSRLVADDCMYSNDDGVLDTNPKAHIMEHWKLPLAYDHGVNPRDYVVHVYGGTAVLNYRVTIHEQFTDADIISEQRYTETYIKQNGLWLLVARQGTNLPANFHKPVAVDTSIYKDYVGQ